MDSDAKTNGILLMALMTPFGLAIFARMLARIRQKGGQVWMDPFGLPDLILGFLLVALFSCGVFFGSGTPDADGLARTITTEDVIANSIFSLTLVAAVIGLLAYRKHPPGKVFGLDRMPFWRAALVGGLSVLALFPLLILASLLMQNLLQDAAQEQEVVKMFREAAGSDERTGLIAMFVMAVVVAPIVEEVLFRGYFYPVFKKWAGVVPSLIFTTVLFAVVHDSITVAPCLVLLAAALTVAYEWSGSLLVPIAMHATFNATQLGILLANLSQAPAP